MLSHPFPLLSIESHLSTACSSSAELASLLPVWTSVVRVGVLSLLGAAEFLSGFSDQTGGSIQTTVARQLHGERFRVRLSLAFFPTWSVRRESNP